MAKCIKCGTDIPEGAQYCEDCLSKQNTAKDSESYLDSLLNAVMTEEKERREIAFPRRKASSLVSMPEDKEAAGNTVSDPVVKPAEKETEELLTEDAFDTFFPVDEELPDLRHYSIFEDIDEDSVDRMLEEELGGDIDRDTDFSQDSDESTGHESVVQAEPSVPEPVGSDALSELFGEEHGFGGTEEEEEPVRVEDDFADSFDGTEENEMAAEEPIADFGEFADLFNEDETMSVQEDTPVQEEIETPEGMSEQNEQPAQEEMAAEPELDDFADLFAGLDEDGGGLFEFGAEPVDMDASADEPKDDILAAALAEDAEPETVKEEKSKSGKKKPGRLAALYHKLFDNVKVDPSKIKQPPTKEEIEAKKKEKLEAKERSKEEKEALLAEKKEQEKQAKQEKQRLAREAKEEKKARKLEEAKLLLEEMEKTRINRAGASIVFIFFAMIAVVIIVGTSIFSYSLSIRNAEYEFNRDEYTLAYNEIYGLDVKDEDILLYDRIMTVMYVQKQLNSYYNYYGMNDKPKALDSLLKGLQRYEKYIDLAVSLDVDSDLDSVRKKILTEISTVFSLSEQEAMEIIQSDTQAEYSKKVYDAVEQLQE